MNALRSTALCLALISSGSALGARLADIYGPPKPVGARARPIPATTPVECTIDWTAQADVIAEDKDQYKGVGPHSATLVIEIPDCVARMRALVENGGCVRSKSEGWPADWAHPFGLPACPPPVDP